MSTRSQPSQRRKLANACADMGEREPQRGTSGNLSVRVGGGFLITPSGIPYGQITQAKLVAMDLDGGYASAHTPSSEWRMHQAIYQRHAEAGAVVHTHSTHAAALSCLRRDVPAFHYMIAVTGGDSLPCAKYATFGTEALSRNMLLALEDRVACLLANHGMICFAATLEKALSLAVEVENLCQQYFIACQAGTPTILGKSEMRRILARFATYGVAGAQPPA